MQHGSGHVNVGIGVRLFHGFNFDIWLMSYSDVMTVIVKPNLCGGCNGKALCFVDFTVNNHHDYDRNQYV